SAPDVVGWDSPWGRGRPGWHIECSAMIEAHLGETIDIHGGGLDLVFPHHENERAQSTCVHGGARFARYWMHNGMVNMGSEKMAKSTGNLLLVRDLRERFDAEALRLALLTAHYRQPLEWSDALLDDAMQRLDRMYGALRDAGVEGAVSPEPDRAPQEAPPAAVVAALEDDLNTPQALAELFSVARAANKSGDPRERLALARSLRAGAGLLGLLERDPQEWFAGSRVAGERDAAGLTEADIDALIQEREDLRRERRFAEADGIRDRLAAAGILIEDGAGGTRWRRAR
ncbi:MAG: cysteine--tRNA ligase, partial [Gammaproteobacteria bacterium]|nr:cysteine--tRNA ligase [Gammaproteobacteria bacterium]